MQKEIRKRDLMVYTIVEIRYNGDNYSIAILKLSAIH